VEPDIDAAAFIKALHVIKALHGSGALEIADDGSITLESGATITLKVSGSQMVISQQGVVSAPARVCLQPGSFAHTGWQKPSATKGMPPVQSSQRDSYREYRRGPWRSYVGAYREYPPGPGASGAPGCGRGAPRDSGRDRSTCHSEVDEGRTVFHLRFPGGVHSRAVVGEP